MHILPKQKTLFRLAVATSLIWAVEGCNRPGGSPASATKDSSVAVVLDWYDHALHADRHTEGFRTPVAARAYAYIGLAAWEASLAALPEGHLSLAANLPGLQLPEPEPGASYHLPTVLNACYHSFFEKIFLATPRNVEQERKELKARWMEAALKETDTLTLRRSLDFGKKVAFAVYAWSATDSIGHVGHLHNFDREYMPPEGHGYWLPCADFPTPALLPNWGRSRTFIAHAADFQAAPLPAFSLEPQSLYFAQALEVYTINKPLSDENQWIAEFWSDDHPGLTFSSAGRWISITNQVVRQESPSIEKTLETYLLTGLAMSDAMVACWKSKYDFNLLRPETFIRLTMQADWRPILHTPPFPAYPSGHAMVGAAAAEVLTKLYGEDYGMTDFSHEGRIEFKGQPRSFGSFYEMASEDAFSRILLGVHFRVDCEEGTRLGLLIGKKVAALPLRSEHHK